jgi:hypothetical protein
MNRHLGLYRLWCSYLIASLSNTMKPKALSPCEEPDYSRAIFCPLLLL